MKSSKTLADTLAKRLERYPELVRMVDYRVDVDFFERYALYFLEVDDLASLERDLAQGGFLRKLLERGGLIPFYETINERLSEFSEDQDLGDDEEDLKKGLKGLKTFLKAQEGYLNGSRSPHRLRKSLEELWASRKGPDDEIIEDGYYVPKDKSILLMMVKPTNPQHDVKFFQKMARTVEEEIQNVQERLPEVKVELAGMVKMMDEEWSAIQRDLRFTGALALILVLLLLFVSFRTVKIPFLVAIPLIMGIIWTLGLTKLLVGRLNIVTSTIAPVLLGLGVDFTIHLVSRFQEERGQGKTFDEAITVALTETGKGIFIGAITTSFAFFSLIFGDFRGIQEMGIVVGVGLMATFFAVFLVLSPLLFLADRAPLSPKRRFRRVDMDVMETLGRKIVRHPRVLIFSGVLGSLILGSGLLLIRYEYNTLALLPKILSVDIQDEVREKFDMSFDFGILRVPSLDISRKATKKLKENPEIAMVDALTEYLPDNQKGKIPYLRRISQSIRDLEVTSYEKESPPKLQSSLVELRKNLLEIRTLAFIGGLDVIEEESKRVLEDLEKNLEVLKINHNYSVLERDFSSELKRMVGKLREMAEEETLEVGQLPPEVLDKFISKKGDFVLYVYPKRDIWDERSMESFNDLLLSIQGEATGSSLIWARILEYLKRDILVTTLLAALAIFLVLLLNFRSFSLSLMTMIPVFLPFCGHSGQWDFWG